jgi:rubrerythrin
MPLREDELAAALLAGVRLELAMFDVYDRILPKLTDPRFKREIGSIRAQELLHLDVSTNVLYRVIQSPILFEGEVTRLPFGPMKDIEPHLEALKLDLPAPELIRRALVIERDFEYYYGQLFSEIREPATKMRLMSTVIESKGHAIMLGHILTAMNEPQPDVAIPLPVKLPSLAELDANDGRTQTGLK